MVKWTKEVMRLASEIKGLILDKNDLSDGEVLDSIYDIVKKYDIHKPKKWARKCDVTNEGMNVGWCFGDGSFYTKYYKDTIDALRKDFKFVAEGFFTMSANDISEALDSREISIIDECIGQLKFSDEAILYMAYASDYVYYTEWDADDDAQYIEINGVLIEKD